MVLCTWWICGVVCIWCCAHVGYAVLCIYDTMYMLDMQCYVHMVFYAFCTYGYLYIWCCVHDCKVVHWVCGAMYMLYMWCYVHVVLCTYRACDVMHMWCRAHVMHVMLCTFGSVYTLYASAIYMWHCVHVVQVVPCTCDVVHKLCRWWQCTCGTYGTSVDAFISWCYMTCVDVCVWCTLRVCAHGWGEGTGFLSSVATNLECIQNKDKGGS